MKYFIHFIPFCFLCLLITGCTSQLSLVEHEPVEIELIPEDVKPTPFSFRGLKYTLPLGATVAAYGCNAYDRLLIDSSNFAKQMNTRQAKDIFNEVMEAQGYDVAGRSSLMFDEIEDEMRAMIAVGARITDVKMNLCPGTTRFLSAIKERGAVEVTVEWTVFDHLNKKNVYKTSTQGYAKSRAFNMEGIALTLQESFGVAAHNLGADPIFREMILTGVMPKKLPPTVYDSDELPSGKFDMNEEVVIHNKPISKTLAQGRFENIQDVAVRIQAGLGHGSGYFITKDGHILTNAHVVGYAKRVRIATHMRKRFLPAEVLRVDRRRDVALLKLEKIPEKMDIRILPIQTAIPDIGDDLYAIGAPRSIRLQDTVTKGIMSAYRYERREKQYFIQSDVDTHGGNSGGPLLDAYGNIIGMSVAGYDPTGHKISTGLNLFIPIEDALDKMDIHLK